MAMAEIIAKRVNIIYPCHSFLKAAGMSDNERSGFDQMGWLMGLEPTTTGITIRDSTN